MAEEREAPTRVIPCELCDSEAELHCAADSAFLCRSCDSKIHSSNFLAARHLRRFLCPNCKSLTGNNISGAVIPPQSHGNIPDSCSSILPSDTHPPPCLSSRCSSLESVQTSKLSSTADAKNWTARRNRRRDGCVRVQGRNGGHGEVDGIFLNWCEILRVKGRSVDSIVSTASLALSVLMEKPVRILPYRVSLTASFWFGIRVAREAMMTWQNLRRLQEISGVPGKTIMAVEMRISRAMRWWSVDLREGWAETEGAWAES